MLNQVKTRITAMQLLLNSGIPYPCTTFFEVKFDHGLCEQIAENYLKWISSVPPSDLRACFLTRFCDMFCLGAQITAEQLKQETANLSHSTIQAIVDNVCETVQPEIFARVFGDVLGKDSISIIAKIERDFTQYILSEDAKAIESAEDIPELFARGYDIGATIIMSDPNAENTRGAILSSFTCY